VRAPSMRSVDVSRAGGGGGGCLQQSGFAKAAMLPAARQAKCTVKRPTGRTWWRDAAALVTWRTPSVDCHAVTLGRLLTTTGERCAGRM